MQLAGARYRYCVVETTESRKMLRRPIIVVHLVRVFVQGVVHMLHEELRNERTNEEISESIGSRERLILSEMRDEKSGRAPLLLVSLLEVGDKKCVSLYQRPFFEKSNREYIISYQPRSKSRTSCIWVV